jgi:hypothetical protein
MPLRFVVLAGRSHARLAVTWTVGQRPELAIGWPRTMMRKPDEEAAQL